MSITVDEILTALLQRRGSDLHLKVGRPPLFRISGSMVPSEFEPLDAAALDDLILGLMGPHLVEKLERDRAVDFAYALGEKARFRVNAFYQRGHLGAVLRAVPMRVPTLEQLYLPSVCKDIALSPSGLVLVTGPTGSGKSTTLAAMIEHINDRRQAHIMTIEDPVEFVYADRNSVINQREVGLDAPTFSSALRHVLRQDPDVILVGEMRDPETISTAITAAETGHLVFSTLHTNDAPQTVDRILDTFPPEQQLQVRMQLSTVLRAVVSQRLVPMASKPGRVAAVEVMVSSPPVQKHIADGDIERLHRIIEESAGGFYRMQTLNQSLGMLAAKALITTEAAEAASPDADELHRIMRTMQPQKQAAAT
ncbi:MAG: type IV pilus twitching motility protein PilT [Armatimonadetes bacterium]|nr:type IV pilus twitching motility protein PilT [Armatimonadota bacterium]